MEEVTKNAKTYMQFHDNIEHKVITSTHDYLSTGQFTDSVVDVVVPATAQALRINLFIYCRHGDNILLIPALCRGSTMDVYLKYDRVGGTYHGGDHYTPMVQKKGTRKDGVPKIPLTSVLTPASVRKCNISGNFWAAHQKKKQTTAAMSATSQSSLVDISASVNSTPHKQNVSRIQSNSGTSHTSGALGKSGIYNTPCSFRTASQALAVSPNTLPTPTEQSNIVPGRINLTPLQRTQNITPAQENAQSSRNKLNVRLHHNKREKRNVTEEKNDDEAILNDMLTGCEDDSNGYYFDEFGGGLEGSTSKVAPLEREIQPTIGTEELMSFEEFAEIDREGTYIASKEDSDIEPEPEPENISSQSQLCRGAQFSSDEDLSQIQKKLLVEGRPKKRKWCKTSRISQKVLGMDAEMVDSIPWDIDGNHKFTLFSEENQWIDKVKDGRWFKMNTSKLKTLNGYRKTGKCTGSIICQNLGCSKLQTEGVLNSNPSDFRKEYGCHVCKCCGYYAVQIHCGCKKTADYNLDTKEITVFYEGEHNCTPKPDIKSKINFFENLPLRSSLRLTHTELRNDCMRYFVSKGEYDKAMEVALNLNDPHLIERMRYITPGSRNISNYAEDIAVVFGMIGEIKAALDKWDKYYIWAYNCGKTNGGDTYVFKTSQHHLETALKMDASIRPLNGKRSILSFEKSYFDGMHKRVRGFKTLTLWVHHPGMRRMKRLASMDCKRETQDMVALFFRLFNSALQDFTGDANYTFNPAMLVTDEAGAIHQGLHDVFGHDFLDRISTCQWHFKKCAWRQLVHVKEDDRATFRATVNGLCKASTAAEYELLAQQMDRICKRNNIIRWWNWWKVRRYHLVPALRGFGWTGTNWAEIGQSKMKKHVRIWLISALWEDVINAVGEHAEWKNFVNNTGVMTGKGPTVLSHKLKERKQMRDLADSIIEALRTGRVDADFFKHRQPERYFIGSAAAKHRVPRNYPAGNPTQDSQRPKSKPSAPASGGVAKKQSHVQNAGAVPGEGKGRGRRKRSAGGNVVQNKKPLGWGRSKTSRSLQYTEEDQLLTGTLEEVTDVDDADLANILAGLAEEGQAGSNVLARELQTEENVFSQKTHQKRGPKRAGLQSLQTNNDPRRNPERRRRGRNKRYEDNDAYTTDEEMRPYDKLHPTQEQEAVKMAENPPTYCFLWRPPPELRPPIKKKGYRLYPQVCNGCLIPFADQLYDEPGKNLVFRFKTYRQYYVGGQLHTGKRIQNAYYHARDMGCLRAAPELEDITIEKCYIDRICFSNLTEAHKEILRKRHHWVPLRRVRAKVIDDSD